jgi:hypothetical protein
MSAAPHARRLVLRNRKPKAPPFHRHIARGKLLRGTYEVGDTVVIYEITATDPPGPVRVTPATEIVFE